ncbi:TPA: site-specific DNA-methyltransferase [Streptococcus equi subsp. zooepidemicus]|nr:site-specific DNA-methyltransferase [Streptococcus equi subsp. zooepidemicus]HEL0612444.1 site-specific DNA-methyltransferase [Streptococcus equi subsp. zooepidemicus]HEL1344496.1 site-specific DNA-methyltransferase [Streptococcus equi subsp. zooepidemicus]
MKQELEQLLSQHEAFLVEGELNKNKLAELARQYNPELLNLLMSNEKISQHFFATLETGVLVFKKDVFLQFLNNKEFLPDSFTAYKTKIGLATGDKYLSENQEVVLNFPYKDCVLEGGQTKDDAKRQEIFFNETLAPTEINRLLDDKVLTNFKRYDKDGEHEVEELADTDNLIIKGNNLIALHSLKKRFAGNVKLIYIDPPYNTGNDSFKYNDSFNHSTWLTFMKNRLEVARELLSKDGVIYISIDDKEQAYLKVLMDEIFGKENFLTQFNFQVRYAEKSIAEAKVFTPLIEYTLMYAKDSTQFRANQPTVPYTDDKFIWEIKELTDGAIEEIDGNKVGIFKKGEWELVQVKPDMNALKETWVSGSIYSKMSYGQVYQKIVEPRVELDGNGALYKVYGRGEDGLGYRYYTNPQKANANRGKMFSGMPLERKAEIESGQAVKHLPIVNFADFAGDYGNIRHEGGVALNSGKKPEKLLKILMEYVTSNNDIVLDFFGGSGSTAATAHKMGRQYISIEQMDYIEDKIVERLNNVIKGDATGISKDVNWTGGGSFVYAELKNDAQDFKNAIIEASTTDKLMELFELAKKSSFLSYRIDPKKLKKNEFEKLSLAEQKQILSEIIDNNNLYVNYADMDDSDYGISPEDKKLNHAFYGKEK